MVRVSTTRAVLLLQSFNSIFIVAVLLTVCGLLAWEYHSVGTPGETPILEQVCPEELDEDEVDTVVGLELTTTGVGVAVSETAYEVGTGIGEKVGRGGK